VNSVRNVIENSAKEMPLQKDFIDKYCRAEKLM
jgi:hypothetical protein